MWKILRAEAETSVIVIAVVCSQAEVFNEAKHT